MDVNVNAVHVEKEALESKGLLRIKVPIYNESARATPIKSKNISNLRSKLHKLGKKMLLN